MNNKTIVAINRYDSHSTGDIVRSILDSYKKDGYETYFVIFEDLKKYSDSFCIKGNKLDVIKNKVLCRYDGSDGFRNKKETKKLIAFLNKVRPSIIFLNNLHSHFINLPLLFDYIKNNDVKVYWTLHDCWPFTGRCVHYLLSECDQWKTECRKCKNRREYPHALFRDKSNFYFNFKKKLIFENSNKITIICPSKWIYNQAKISFLNKCKLVYIPNGIIDNKNVSVAESFAQLDKNNLNLFAAASPFTDKKGLNDILNVANKLKDKPIRFYLAGLSKKQTKRIKTDNVISLGVLNKEHMDYMFENSDAFLNLSKEDNFPSVNIEAISHGLPIICFDNGGVSEVVNESNGIIISNNSIDDLISCLLNFQKNIFLKDIIIKNSIIYSVENMLKKYKEVMK